MFSFIGKLIKRTIQVVVGVFVLFVVIGIYAGSDDTKTVNKTTTTVEKSVVKKVEKPKVVELTAEQKWSKQWVESDLRGKVSMVSDKYETDAVAICRNVGKMASKFPEEIDYKFGWKDKTVFWTDGDEVNAGQLTITMSGKAMNGFGMMLPFSVECNFAINTRGAQIHPTIFKWNSGGEVNVLLDLPAPSIKQYKGTVFTPVSYQTGAN